MMVISMQAPGSRDAWEIFIKMSVGWVIFGMGMLGDRCKTERGLPREVWVRAFIVLGCEIWWFEDDMVLLLILEIYNLGNVKWISKVESIVGSEGSEGSDGIRMLLI